ncbi:MAG: PIN domain-containing protein [Ammonifex sp.]|jgi:PIN domain nuclease of toxin-antitoxin system|nr:MAG: PIN domain-containing protein [Ammonifex sp.]
MEEDMLYVLDTHVLIWYFTGSKRLKRQFKELIDNVRSQGGRLLIPTIVLAEAMHIAEKGRVHFDFTEMYRLIKEEPEFEIVSFSPDILEESTQISNIPEIHDRIIVATAKFYQAGILTKDRVIRNSGEVEVNPEP